MTPRYEVYKDQQGGFRWRLCAANGEIVASSEGYSSRASAVRGATDAAKASGGAEVVHSLAERITWREGEASYSPPDKDSA